MATGVPEPRRGADTGPIYDLTEWVAVFRTALTLDDLDEDAEALLDLAPDNLIVGSVRCHEGLADRLGVSPATFVSGVAAETRWALDWAMNTVRSDHRFRHRPLLVGEFRVLRLGD